MTTFLLAAAIAILTVLSAFFSSAETVLFSLAPVQLRRLRQRKPALAASLERKLADPSRPLSAILAGNTLVNFAIASLGYRLVSLYMDTGAAGTSVAVFTLLLLVFGEIAPKQFGMRNAEKLAPFYNAGLDAAMRLLSPACMLMMRWSRVFKDFLKRERRALSDDDLRAVMETAAAGGVLDREEEWMVDGILDLPHLHASDEMTPRVDLEGLDILDSPETRRAAAFATRHKFLPVWRKTPDAMEGMLNVEKFLMDPAHDLAAATEDALFVPEYAPLSDILLTFVRSGRRIACVLDEYGGTAGVITRGDILEVVADPVEEAEEEIAPDGEGGWICKGTVSLETIERELDIELSAENADRLSGWMMSAAGRLPHPGQEIRAQGVVATVLRRRGRRIEEVRLEKDPEARENADEEEADLIEEATEDAPQQPADGPAGKEDAQ